jgi:ABC-type Fe3+-hydroxamate transport system substrate-binding protein
VLVCVGHDESLSRMYVAVKETFYDELIELAGGVNACTETSQKYPEISPEGLAVMNPDVIIDVFPNIGKFSSKDWKNYRAVIITNDYASIPGPRFVLLLQDFAKAIHE